MLRLHEEILLEIKALIVGNDLPKGKKHARWRSIETLENIIGEKATQVVRRSLDAPWLGRSNDYTLVTAPKEAANVAKVFERMVWPFSPKWEAHENLIWWLQLPRFFLYEEYGAKYESMLESMGSLSKTLPTWSAYERGIESLVNSLIPQNGRALGSRKGLTLEDLLIKV